jgi:hypothetical protein
MDHGGVTAAWNTLVEVLDGGKFRISVHTCISQPSDGGKMITSNYAYNLDMIAEF